MPSTYAAKKAGYRAKNGKINHFGDARDTFVNDSMSDNKDVRKNAKNPCTSKGLSTMPVRERTEKNKSGYVPA